ncbi:MAG TPA: heme o synthase [Vicinamibacterales bacterium]|nr:heme o synthase [Acidobacteriota bacterium]HOC17453.1 heme o synthase [Vicinamibacterales bacterium]
MSESPRPAVSSLPWPGTTAKASDFVALAKPRLNLLVVASTGAGFFLAAERIDPAVLFHTIVGTALVAGGAAAFNEIIERDSDALMRRTRTRPLPTRRLEPAPATWFAFSLSILGLMQLAAGATTLAAGVALATLGSYVLVYTPMKRRSPMATLVGGIPGALPPVIGWTAASGELTAGAWVLFAIVFLWQMPHFLAIAWLCRDDYARAGLKMLPVVEPDGRSTAQQTVLYAAVLVPVSLLPAVVGLAATLYFAGALVLGLAFFALAVRFAARRDRSTALRLFLGSIVYLPLLWGILLLDH